MNFQKILKQVAAENNTTPEDVYREMQVALEDAYSHKDDTQESQALWKEIGFDKNARHRSNSSKSRLKSCVVISECLSGGGDHEKSVFCGGSFFLGRGNGRFAISGNQ